MAAGDRGAHRRRAICLAYALNRANLGERLDRDICSTPRRCANYLATTPSGMSIHGGWSRQFGQSERLLFPGVIAIVLTIAGLLTIDRRRVT